ncbi:MAG TPA: PilT/PilU family type 4a pilus ATPase [Gammaproteobacteria bacterium]|nr:PilT/PilU family type 4a pilus ATPase [Gammaproteobacteria bacterium]
MLKSMIKLQASDLYLTTGAPPCIKSMGLLKPVTNEIFAPGDIASIAATVMDQAQQQAFAAHPECNLALSQSGIGRFRVNFFRQRSEVGMVVRHIKATIPDMDSLNLPTILQSVIMQQRGLVLVVGATGSGKSTTLASLIDYRNRHASGHIITIEDPIEFIHRHHRSLINQREVGVDTDSYADALKNTLRQAPDVILIGEIRDQETMQHAITFAETGHLCISTLHANNANQALDRIINFFPQSHKPQLLLDLSLNLRAIISQRLVPTLDRQRTAAIEILLDSPRTRDLIGRGEVAELKNVMTKSGALGMQTFDGALLTLLQQGKISVEEALRHADSENNLKLQIQRGKSAIATTAGTELSLVDEVQDAGEDQRR